MNRFVLLLTFLIFTILTGCSVGQSSENNKTEQNDNISQPQNNDNDDMEQEKRVYGKSLNKTITIQDFQNATLYRPVEITKKTPVVLFAPGWGSRNHNAYKTLLSFIASQGYLVIYSQCDAIYSVDRYLTRYTTVLNDQTVKDIVDRDKIGVVGHSAGGGSAFKILKYFSDNGYGKDGRFIFVSDPWFAFDMSTNDFSNIPENTKLIIQHYGDAKNVSTDPRIPITIYRQLSFLGDQNRDFQNYETLTHGYPSGSRSPDQMQVLLKPLDALMENVFLDKVEAKEIALNLGSDTPLNSYFPDILPNHSYPYPCYGDQNIRNAQQEYALDYCFVE
jgi:hypothetical protein